ncbi:MAG: exonuclease SbcCD subunit D C-terminal domain-containing protein [Deltaproteobacteria bacterium]|jgi:exonuclease SbcD|nr:exonuclease SbcCD subunit D C-terminal domain-containing protein [Deltaproteobacteria bacterium]
MALFNGDITGHSGRGEGDGRPLKVLHTSDWHLGRTLGKVKKRHEELSAFLDWLLKVIDEEGADVLLVAGDVFDSAAPPVEAQALYYNFLGRLRKSRCSHAVITSGNHDSQAFLSAPRELLRMMDVHVVSEAPDNPQEEIVGLKNEKGELVLIVAAAPFLKDRVLRKASEGESIEERDQKIAAGVKDHYETLGVLAAGLKDGRKIPAVAMGHLFVAGGKTSEGDDERKLYYAGALSGVDPSSFPAVFDYVALGHLHAPQRAGSERVRYSGSPIHMSFNEVSGGKGKKSVTLVTFIGTEPLVKEIEVPVFQELYTVRGDLNRIRETLDGLKKRDSGAWLDVQYDSPEPVGDLKLVLDSLLEGSRMEVLKYNNIRSYEAIFDESAATKPLKDYTVTEVFDKLMEKLDVSPAGRDSLKETFNEALTRFYEESGESSE